LYEQVEKTIEILFTKYIKAIISYEGIHRIETYEYPKEAIREAILNALAHKDYSVGAPIQISVYNDKLMIWNYGQLPESWTIENLMKKHSSIPHNPDIANSFFRAGYIEAWGRGTIKIIEQCKEHQLPIPKFSNNGNDFWVIFRKDIYQEEFLKDYNLNDRQLKALLIWKKQKEITNSMYSKEFNVTDRTALRDLSYLVDKGLLNKVGEKRKTKYIFNL
jgi:ATP-dependent DNA helicase RecG